MRDLGILEADAAHASRMAGYFEAQGFAVALFREAEPLLAALSGDTLQMVLLGAAGEPASALSLLRRIRERSRVPVILLGPADDTSQAAILEAGADDVAARTLPLRALHARIRAILRRAEWGIPAAGAPARALNGWRLRPERRQLLRPDGTECPLTTAEFDLLRLLVEFAGQPVSRDDIAAAVFRRTLRAEDRTVDNLVLRLRRKLGPGQQDAVKTVRSAGYMFAGFNDEARRVA
ncbi:response regulator transcription factor [Crenalkalicoccus roseus]|uniref:response regulator transcription factor n=1 Tax=Crenalkalicoccus roseus TaxID=1485588 RepID=UPI001080F349|nr:response regulator transcription factor [Crenalkalicoccus roseus]